MNTPAVQIAPRHWELVAALLQRHVPHCDVWAFGSRAQQRAQPYSDLDLAIAADGELSLSTLAALAADFEDSALPFKVDVLDWSALSPAFRKTVQAQRVRVQSASAAGREILQRPQAQ